MHRKPLRNAFAKFTTAVLEITVGHWTLSNQILLNVTSWSDKMTERHTSTSWVIFFKVLFVNKLCPVKFVKCPTTRKIWKDICPVNQEKIISCTVIVTNIIFHVKVSDKILPETFISGGRFSKDPITYRARKVILKTMIHLPWKLALLIFFR